MNTWIDQEEWRAGLLGWGVRGALVSIPSWLWALAWDYRHPLELLAMLLGTVFYVLIFATVSSLTTMTATEQRRRWLEALRSAAWLKLGWILLGIFVAFVLAGLRVQSGWTLFPLAGGAYVDLWSGALITEGMKQFGQWVGSRTTASADSFLWTLVTTLLQGLAVTTGLGFIAGILRILAWLKGSRVSSWRPRRVTN